MSVSATGCSSKAFTQPIASVTEKQKQDEKIAQIRAKIEKEVAGFSSFRGGHFHSVEGFAPLNRPSIRGTPLLSSIPEEPQEAPSENKNSQAVFSIRASLELFSIAEEEEI